MLSIFAVPKQQLDCAQIACAAVDQHRLCTSQRVGAELGRIEPDAGHPFVYEPRILPRRQAVWTIATTGEQELARLPSRQPQVLVDGQTRLVGQLEPHRPARLLLSDGRSVHRVAARRHVIDAHGDDVTAAQLAVDGEIEERKIALPVRHLQLRPDRPDVARPQRRLGADELAFVPRRTRAGFTSSGTDRFPWSVSFLERQSRMRS